MVLDIGVGTNIIYIYVHKKVGSGICSMLGELWFESLLYLFCIIENCVKTSFSCNSGNFLTATMNLTNEKI